MFKETTTNNTNCVSVFHFTQNVIIFSTIFLIFILVFYIKNTLQLFPVSCSLFLALFFSILIGLSSFISIDGGLLQEKTIDRGKREIMSDLLSFLSFPTMYSRSWFRLLENERKREEHSQFI